MTLTSPQSIWIVVVAVVGVIKLALEAGKATPAPPVGPALGSKGVNIMAFCKDYNARTADKPGYVIPVEITVFDVCSFLPFTLLFPLWFLIFFWISFHSKVVRFTCWLVLCRIKALLSYWRHHLLPFYCLRLLVLSLPFYCLLPVWCYLISLPFLL